MSRGHVQGYDSNAGQFERMGNPWTGEASPKRKVRKIRRFKPCRPGLPRRVPRDSREGDELEHIQCKAALAAKLGLSKRTLVSLKPEISPTLAIYRHPSRMELTAEQRVKRDEQRAEFQARAEAAAAAWAASEAAKAAERRRLEAMRDALEARLAAL